MSESESERENKLNVTINIGAKLDVQSLMVGLVDFVAVPNDECNHCVECGVSGHTIMTLKVK